MEPARFRFDRFILDSTERQLRAGDAPVELTGRYLDALALLVRNAGTLVTKERFLGEIWRGVPVTDEALTQCIKTLRRLLGDDAAKPRFIETIPKHGYRFIAAVEPDARTPAATRGLAFDWRRFFMLGGAGTLGGALAGAIGGLIYGFAGASQPMGSGIGSASVLLVVLWLTIAAALMGGAGVSFGIAAARFASARPWIIAGGALGGLAVGGAVKLLGLDAFHLLLGDAPSKITGAAEGLALGGAVGLGAWLGERGQVPLSFRRRVAIAALVAGVAGTLITSLGGRLMAGSLDLLARHFPESTLRFDSIGGLFGEDGFGPISEIVTGGLEGVLFGGCIVGAMIIARQNMIAAADEG